MDIIWRMTLNILLKISILIIFFSPEIFESKVYTKKSDV